MHVAFFISTPPLALSAVRAVPVMWEQASRFFDHFDFSPIQTDARLLVRAMASLLFASASSQWLRLDSEDQLRRWSAGDFGEIARLIWLRSIDDLFLLSLNVVGVAGQQQQQSSAQGLGWPSCGRSAGGRHCRRAGRRTRRGSRRLRSCWGDTSSPASTGGSVAQLLLLAASWSMDLCVEMSKSKSVFILNAITNPSIHSTRKMKTATVSYPTFRREIAHPDRG